jgi:carbonic anhydrase/acetyltransferase-like protein (isoleucine patch superfamily)
MKGDFTRLTFQPDKHYTSVRMQQGRLQLDSDWNEQADIQAHLYRTQVVDLIGAESGVPTSGNDLNQPYKDSFKISVTSDNTDLVIAHGHFYVNGTLCELEETRVGFKISSPPSNRIQAASLIVDGRKFAKGQWLKIVDSPSILQINDDINTQTLELPLNTPVTTGGEIHRVATYKTQSDYPNPESFENGLLLAYLDVWQRHITTAEDPSLREVALNIPDTTTRSKTVWQLKLQPLNRKFIKDNQGAEDLLQKLDDLSIEALKKSFDSFLTDKIALSQSQQQVAKVKFNDLLPKILHPVNDSSWQEDFTDLLESLFSQENSDLKSSFSSLLNEVVSTDLEQQQIYQSFGGLLIGDTAPKQSFEIVLAKIAPAQTEKEVSKQAFGSLLADTISTQKEKATLQQLFDDLLTKIVLSSNEKMGFQASFDTLIANATATPVEKQTWTDIFSSLLLKIDQLNLNGDIFRLAFESLLDKAIASDKVLREIESYEKDETIAGDLKSPEWSSLIKDAWNTFAQSSKDRKPSMNACAKQCPVSGNMTTNSTGYRRLQNQLYRVEIHQPGQVIDGQPGNASNQKATFKWSRDNGSIVSLIENSQDIQKGIITIRVSAQDAWSSSKTGQWIELLDEERELKGLPGQLARLNRVSGNKIEFDASSLDGNSLQAPTKVRRWDHTTKESSIFTRTEWVELEDGIKVQFNENSEYKTGDYWLIPARASTNDIEWPNDQAQDIKNRQPLSQPALGVHHDYCLLASVKVKSKNFLPLTEDQDQRFIFPALAFAFDKRGDVIKGNLGVGINTNEKPIARLHIKASEFLDVKGNTITAITGSEVTVANTSGLHKGDQIRVKNSTEIVTITEIDPVTNKLTTEPELTLTVIAPGTTKEFQYRQPIALFENDQGEAKFTALANGNIGIGGVIPNVALEVNGKIKTTDLAVTNLFSAESFRGSKFEIAQNPTSNTPTIRGAIQISGNGIEFKAVAPTTSFKFTDGDVAINRNLAVSDDATITNDLTVGKTATVTTLAVSDDATITNDLTVGKTATVTTLAVSDDATITNDLTVGKTATVTTLAVSDDATITNDLTVGKTATVTTLAVSDDATITNDLTVGKTATVTTLAVSDDATITNDLTVNGNVKAGKLFAQNILVGTVATEVVLVKGTATAQGFSQVSSRTLKEGITDLTSHEAITILKSLNPVKFTYTGDNNKSQNAGFIVEDTPDLVISHDKQAVKLLDVVAVLTRAMKDQQALSTELASIVKNQHGELEILREKVRVLEKHTSNSSSSFSFVEPPKEPAIQHSSRIVGRNKMAFRVNFKHFIHYLLGGMRRRSS